MLFINDAFAEATPPPAGGGTEMLVMVGIFFVIMYFMIIRPQSKRQKEQKALMASISKGDEVVTSGGMMGKIKGVTDDVVRIELAENVIIKVQKHAINSVLPKGTISQD
ncbi:preprotein translocase subunit YajC [Gammaproteobacteria bacterium]|jgi:preprotein translocase subunit YajC|nr:preprotein translocase subunit YajC [Pseudomonadota bacterium]MDB0063726.1 preprotein translocase subunit YajC [Gammaproteobacteria bacterium]